MKDSDIQQLASAGIFQDTPLKGKVVETHISWVILSGKHAFKIKKPLVLPFLDYSTLELRKSFCEKEFELNRRFSNVYLGVLPISREDDRWVIGSDTVKAADYCVFMKRMSSSKKMDNRLHADEVTTRNIEALARTIAAFHNKAQRIFTPYDMGQGRATFNDISAIISFASKYLGDRFADSIPRAIETSDAFLIKYQERIQQRIDQALKRDVHGDLHSGNIFLYKRPILFDCIEFNDAYRQIDVLYEIAFLCMDLESFNHRQLADRLIDEYSKHIAVFQRMEDQDIFVYFKCLRANIRAKVHALSIIQDGSGAESSLHLSQTQKYLTLMTNYVTKLQTLQR